MRKEGNNHSRASLLPPTSTCRVPDKTATQPTEQFGSYEWKNGFSRLVSFLNLTTEWQIHAKIITTPRCWWRSFDGQKATYIRRYSDVTVPPFLWRHHLHLYFTTIRLGLLFCLRLDLLGGGGGGPAGWSEGSTPTCPSRPPLYDISFHKLYTFISLPSSSSLWSRHGRCEYGPLTCPKTTTSKPRTKMASDDRNIDLQLQLKKGKLLRKSNTKNDAILCQKEHNALNQIHGLVPTSTICSDTMQTNTTS